MIYVAVFLLTLLFSTLKWEIDPQAIKMAALVALSYVVFADSLRLRFRPVVKYHSLALAMAFLALAAFILFSYFGLPVAYLPLLALFDIKGERGIEQKGLVPLKIIQMLSIDGGLRTLITTAAFVYLTTDALQSFAMGIASGVLLGGAILALLHLLRIPYILFLVPLIAILGLESYEYIPLLSIGISGTVIGNFSRMSAKQYLLTIKRFYPLLLSVTIIAFTLLYSPILISSMGWDYLVYAGVIFIGYLLFCLIVLKIVGMRFETGLFYSIASLPGVSTFTYILLVNDSQTDALPCVIVILFVLRLILLPRAIEMYGRIFTGRDPYSSLKEHGAVVELPV